MINGFEILLPLKSHCLPTFFLIVNTDAYFKLKDVINVLQMKQANSILLKESLTDVKQAANYKDILLDVGVSHLDSEQTLKILARRVDMK